MKKIVLILLAIIAIGCHNDKKQVGVIIPLTGTYSDVGHWMKIGIDLAIEDLSSEGINIVPLYEDSQSTPSIAISAYQKLKTIHNIKHYISTVSSVCLALKPIVQNDGLFMFVNAGHKELIDDDTLSPNIYRHALTIPQEAIFLASQIKGREKGDKTIALLYTNNDIGVEFEKVFSSQFIEQDMRIHSMSYEENEMNLKNIVQKINDIKPDMYVIYGYTKNFAQLVKTIREQSFDGAIYANQGFSTPSVIAGAGVAGNNVFYSDYDIPNNAYIQDLNKRALQKYNEVISPMSIASYNIMYMIGTSLSHINDVSDIEEFKNYLSEIKSIDINGMNVLINSGEAYIPLTLVENVFEE